MDYQTDMRQDLNSFCSNYFYCESCLRQEHKIVKGFTRYDSLVLCEAHNTEFKPIMKQLYDIFDPVKNPNVKVINL